MISNKELKIVFKLTNKKEKLESLIWRFECNIITDKIGIVGHSSTGIHFDLNDNEYFHSHLSHIEKTLTENFIILIKSDLKHVEAELSKYIDEDPKG